MLAYLFFTIIVKEENETSEAAGDNHETTVVTNSCAFEGEVVDRVYAAVGGDDKGDEASSQSTQRGARSVPTPDRDYDLVVESPVREFF